MLISEMRMFFCLCLGVLLGTSSSGQSQTLLRITEVMSSSGTGGTQDWFELSNLGTNSVDITGWKMDDNSFSFASALSLSGVSTIAAGESVIFLETTGSANPSNDVVNFKAFWGGMTNRQVGTYSGSGAGLSSTSDGVVVFNDHRLPIERKAEA